MPDERELVEPAIPLENLVRDSGQRTRHAIGIHDLRHQPSLRPQQSADNVLENGSRPGRPLVQDWLHVLHLFTASLDRG